MCLAAVPVYLLARMLCSRPAAAVVAALSIAIPAMSYATSIVPEALAYLWFCLAAWLAVRALAAPRPATVAPALLTAALGPLIEKEFVVLPVSLALAAAVLWAIASGRARGTRARLGRALAALAGLALFAYGFNALVVEHVQHWSPGQYVDRHTFAAGALAFGALAIGLGMLPVIGGIASLALPGRTDAPYRAFAAYLGASLVTLLVYTAAKVTHLGGTTTLIEERNVFYLSPLLLCGTALAFAARRLDWRLVALGTALVFASVWSADFEGVGAPYFEAPGLAILALVNRDFIFYVSDSRTLLACAAAVSLVLLALRARRGVPLLAAVLVGAWLLTGEVYATITNEEAANDVFAHTLPPPRGWVDAATHGHRFTLLVQEPLDPNTPWLTEFWNRSLAHVASLNGNAPGPGPASAPGLASADGALAGYTGDPYTLAGPGVVLDAPLVARRVLDGGTYSLYATPHGWRLLEAQEGVYGDGWQPGYALYTYFAPGGPGILRIDLSRTAYTGPGPPGRVTVTVGTAGVDAHGSPAIERVLAVVHRRVPNGHEVTVRVPVARTPVTIKVEVAIPTLIREPDGGRLLGVQVAFSFRRGARLAAGPAVAGRSGRARPRGAISSPP
jgi:hypothetical protein